MILNFISPILYPRIINGITHAALMVFHPLRSNDMKPFHVNADFITAGQNGSLSIIWITLLTTGLTRHKHTIKETNFIKLFSLDLATSREVNLFSFCPGCLFYFFILACVFFCFILGFFVAPLFLSCFFSCSVPFTFAFFLHVGLLFHQSSN